MTPHRRPPLYVFPVLTEPQCEALRVLIGREVKAPSAPDAIGDLIAALGAITDALANAREKGGTNDA